MGTPNCRKKRKMVKRFRKDADERAALCPEHLYSKDGKLYCRPCHEEIRLGKLSIIRWHLESAKHNKNVLNPVERGDKPPKPCSSQARPKEENEEEEVEEEVDSMNCSDQYKESKQNNERTDWKTLKVVCNICGCDIVKSQMEQHLYFSHNIEREKKKALHVCSQCGKSFSKSSDYKTHVEDIHWGYIHRCKICLREFNNRGTIESHLHTHAINKPFKCWICDYSSSAKTNVAIHARKVHKETGVVYPKILKTEEIKYNTDIKGPLTEKFFRPGGAIYSGRKRNFIAKCDQFSEEN